MFSSSSELVDVEEEQQPLKLLPLNYEAGTCAAVLEVLRLEDESYQAPLFKPKSLVLPALISCVSEFNTDAHLPALLVHLFAYYLLPYKGNEKGVIASAILRACRVYRDGKKSAYDMLKEENGENTTIALAKEIVALCPELEPLALFNENELENPTHYCMIALLHTAPLVVENSSKALCETSNNVFLMVLSEMFHGMKNWLETYAGPQSDYEFSYYAHCQSIVGAFNIPTQPAIRELLNLTRSQPQLFDCFSLFDEQRQSVALQETDLYIPSFVVLINHAAIVRALTSEEEDDNLSREDSLAHVQTDSRSSGERLDDQYEENGDERVAENEVVEIEEIKIVQPERNCVIL